LKDGSHENPETDCPRLKEKRGILERTGYRCGFAQALLENEVALGIAA
jgi:hypothetical protein